jgi:nucleoid-associated protein YgaU
MWKFKTIRLGSVFITGLLLLAWLAFLPGQADASFGEDSFAPFWNLQAQGPAPAQSQSAAGATELVSESGLRHRVASGETLWSLARYYHVDLSQLVSANKISDPARLAAGEELIIPGGRDH